MNAIDNYLKLKLSRIGISTLNCVALPMEQEILGSTSNMVVCFIQRLN
jgi:hypothetical protein